MIAFLRDVYRSLRWPNDPNKYDLERFRWERRQDDPDIEDAYYEGSVIHSVVRLQVKGDYPDKVIPRGPQQLREIAVAARAFQTLKTKLEHATKVIGLNYFEVDIGMCDDAYLSLITHEQYKALQKNLLELGWIFFHERRERDNYRFTVHKRISFKKAS